MLLNLLVDANRISVGAIAEEADDCMNLISGIIENICKTVIILYLIMLCYHWSIWSIILSQ